MALGMFLFKILEKEEGCVSNNITGKTSIPQAKTWFQHQGTVTETNN